MAFRATKAAEYDKIREHLANFKNVLSGKISQMAAGNVTSGMIRSTLSNLIAAKAALQAAAAVSGIAAYAQAQEGDETYDVVAEFNALVSAINTAGATLLTGLPTSGGYVLMEQWSANGFTEREFTPAQTASLRTDLQAIVDSIS